MCQARALLSRRRKLAPAVLLLGVVVIGTELWSQVPQETDVEYVLGAGHADVVELRVGYLLEGEELHGVSFRYPEGAPRVVRHEVSLPSGRYTVALEVRRRRGAGRRRVERSLQTPVDGVVRLKASPAAQARLRRR